MELKAGDKVICHHDPKMGRDVFVVGGVYTISKIEPNYRGGKDYVVFIFGSKSCSFPKKDRFGIHFKSIKEERKKKLKQLDGIRRIKNR